MLFQKNKKLLSLLAALIMTLSISSVAMAKGNESSLVNIGGTFNANFYMDSETYAYEGVVSARTTKSGDLNLNIKFTSDNGQVVNGGQYDGMMKTAINVHETITDGAYSVIQGIDTTTITATVPVTVTLQPANGKPLTYTYSKLVTITDTGDSLLVSITYNFGDFSILYSLENSQ